MGDRRGSRRGNAGRSGRDPVPAAAEARVAGGSSDPAPSPHLPERVQSSFSRYLSEIKRFELLTPEEEHALAVRYREEGDVEAAHRLVTSNLRLVVKIALEYQKVYVNTMDLIQEGTIGLMQAVRKFDPYRGVKLSTYAAWWIKAYIMKYILNNIRMVKMGTGQKQKHLFYNLQKEREKLERFGFDATPSLMAASLDSTEAEVAAMSQRMGRREISLDVPVFEGSKKTVGDMIASETAGPDDTFAQAEEERVYGERIASFGQGLSGKDKVIFEERLVAEEPVTLQELGKRFGVSRERVRQIEARLLRRLKEHVGSDAKGKGPA